MNTTIEPMLGVLGLGGGEIILLLLSFLIFLAVIAGIVALVVLLSKRFGRKIDLPPPTPAAASFSSTQVMFRKCPQCGATLQLDVPEGLCPSCLLQRGMGTEGGAPPGTPPFIPPTMSELARLFPQLEILELIGKGGMGAVYKARQPALDRFVALKILAPRSGGDVDFAGRFTREARALAKLSHPNIVGVYDFGQAANLSYFIMEFVDGPNLRQAGKLTPRQAMEIIPQICNALQFAHDEGIVHRDIKPENVLLDKKGRVKIADFGLAKILGQEPQAFRLTGAKDIMGTPHYMAPEQVERPQDVDHRADIYSLGVVFYEMLTGELPLGKFQSPSQKVAVDVRLDEVVLRSLAKEPELRYQHVSEVGTRVATIASTESERGDAAQLPAFNHASWEYKSPRVIFGMPLLHVTSGIDPATGKVRVSRGFFALGGIAKGIFAVGGRAYGVFAFGGVAAGLFAFGGMAMGGIAVGGLALGLLFAFGGLAVAPVAIGSPGLGFVRSHDLIPMLPLMLVVFSGVLIATLVGGLLIHVWAKQEAMKNMGASSKSTGSQLPWLRGLMTATGVFIIVFVLSTLVTFMQPQSFVGVARISLAPKAQQPVDPYQLQTEMETIQSSALLKQVSTNLNLPKRWSIKFNGGAQMGDDQTASLIKQMLVVKPIRNTSLLEISVSSESPTEAAEIANKIAEAYRTFSAENGVEILDRAIPANQPVRPNRPLLLVIGALIGVALGLLIGGIVALVSFLRLPRPATGANKPDHFWRKFAVAVLLLFSIPVVIAIIGMLAAIAIPAFVKARQRAQEMSHQSQTLNTAARPATNITWSPELVANQNPDYQKILDEAKTLMSQGKYEEALQRHIWYHVHSKDDPAQAGVRISFALADWGELGRRYPKAWQALVEIRDADTRQFSESRGNIGLFMEVSAINEQLGKSDASLALFKSIDQSDHKLAEQCYGFMEPALIQHGDYELCMSYIGDPQTKFESIRQSWQRMKTMDDRRQTMWRQQMDRYQEMMKTNSQLPRGTVPLTPDLKKMADAGFIAQTRQLIEILAATGHKPDAEKIREQAVTLLDDARLKSAVSDAEEKIRNRSTPAAVQKSQ